MAIEALSVLVQLARVPSEIIVFENHCDGSPIEKFAYHNQIILRNDLFKSFVDKKWEFKEVLTKGNVAVTEVVREVLEALLERRASNVSTYINKKIDSFASKTVAVMTDEQKLAAQRATVEFYEAVKSLFENKDGKLLFDKHAVCMGAYKGRIAELARLAIESSQGDLKEIGSVVEVVKTQVGSLLKPLDLDQRTRGYVGDYKIKSVVTHVLNNREKVFS